MIVRVCSVDVAKRYNKRYGQPCSRRTKCDNAGIEAAMIPRFMSIILAVVVYSETKSGTTVHGAFLQRTRAHFERRGAQAYDG